MRKPYLSLIRFEGRQAWRRSPLLLMAACSWEVVLTRVTARGAAA